MNNIYWHKQSRVSQWIHVDDNKESRLRLSVTHLALRNVSWTWSLGQGAFLWLAINILKELKNNELQPRSTPIDAQLC